MLRRMLFICAFLACALLLTHRPMGQTGSAVEGRTIVRTRVVHIPFTTLASKQPAGANTKAKPASTLSVSAGGADELPEGPAAFDVFDDGSLLIADPLQKRLAIFDAQGKFLAELKIGFAADSLAITPNGLIQARQASTGDVLLFDRAGRSRPASEAALPPTGEARLLNDKSATITRPSGAKGSLEVRFDKPGLRLLSIENLATDSQGNIYVALEATAGGEQVDVSKYVRKYSLSGKVISEVSDIPLDYFVSPVNELRVRKGVLYQMMSTPTELQINEWDVN